MGLFRRQTIRADASLTPYPIPATMPALSVASPWASADALTVATWAGLLDVVDQLPVTRSQAIALPAVQRGRDLIAQSVARFPLWAMNAAGRLDQQPASIAQPERGRPRFVTILWTVDTLIFHGFAVWEVTERYAEDQRPQHFRFVPPGYVETDQWGNVVRVFNREVTDPRDVIRFDGPHEGILNRSNEAIRATRRLFVNYLSATGTPNPDVELHQTQGDPLTDTQITDLLNSWIAGRQAANGGRVGYTNASVEAKFHGQQPEQLLIAARNAANLDVARCMNLPAWAVDGEVGGSSLTYQTVPARSRELIDYSLAGYMEAITGRLSLDDVLPRGIWASMSTDVLTDGDFGDRMKAYKDAKDAEIYDAATLRKREAGVPIEGLTE